MSQARLQLFLARAYYDVAATETAALVVAGARLGFYKELARGPLDASGLAERTGAPLRYVTSWLANQVAAGYVSLSGSTHHLSEEQAAAFIDETTIGFLPAAFELALALARDTETNVAGAMSALASAKAKGLLDRWLDDSLRARLEAGARFLDLGCGRGATAIEVAARFPASRVIGVDNDPDAIAAARQSSSAVTFRTEWIDAPFDIVLTQESFHEMSAPLAVAQRVRDSLTQDGAWILVEPFAEPNSTSMRLLAATDVLFCQKAGPDTLGPLAGEMRIRDLLAAADFTRVTRREDGFHLVLEARP